MQGSDPGFYLNADPGSRSDFHFNADLDPDPAPHQRDANANLQLLYWSTDLPGLDFKLYTPVNVHGPPRLHCELLKDLDFGFNAEPDPAIHSAS